MRQVRDVLRLKHMCGHSGHQVAAMTGITWPAPAELDDAALERKLFSPPFVAELARMQPDWPHWHAELRRPGVTLLLAWEG